jgi:hypothetical protein
VPGFFGNLVVLLQPGYLATLNRCFASLKVLKAVCKSSVSSVSKLAAEPAIISNLVAVLAQSHVDTAPLAVWLLLQLAKTVPSCLETLSTQPDIMQRISRVAIFDEGSGLELMDLLASNSSR